MESLSGIEADRRMLSPSAKRSRSEMEDADRKVAKEAAADADDGKSQASRTAQWLLTYGQMTLRPTMTLDPRFLLQRPGRRRGSFHMKNSTSPPCRPRAATLSR